MAARTLVLGGARSGKSAHAEGLIARADPVTYVATARRDPDDAEWAERIAAHVARRPAHWRTAEAPAPEQLPAVLTGADPAESVLVDDIATWLTGLLDDTGAWDRDPAALQRTREHRERLAEATRRCGSRLVLVSAEVGLGIVPSTRSGRLFRDELGALNAQLAEECDEVVLLVAGVALQLR
ncbi:bifunctional adenosylcobinamide kinase/adenosylcobinamide-phosphate guanylyltransferase [Saccharopolyspora montiporae]|uniref:bifunctional adenosylcobinamide kinase/adenosylcobinamide-phosphate guanylyltransferase n=1 Tax=Saccharopolyspora montiporae TaxID=2781240 RepID=UPI00351C7CE6